MDFSSWIRRTLLKKNQSDPTNSHTNLPNSNQKHKKQEEEEELGVTDRLIEFIKTFTIDTFKSFSLQQDDQVRTKIVDGNSTDNNVQRDLSDWQERHAMLVLTKVQEISKLRYVLCPRHLKERQFWQIYFVLVKSYVAPFELQAIRKAKLRRMAMEDEKPVNNANEVEMAETKQSIKPSPEDEDLDSL